MVGANEYSSSEKIVKAINFVRAHRTKAVSGIVYNAVPTQWCGLGVRLILNSMGYPGTLGNAKEFGPGLIQRGWRKIPGDRTTQPLPGDVIVFQHKKGSPKHAGHVQIYLPGIGWVSDFLQARTQWDRYSSFQWYRNKVFHGK